MTLLLAGGTCAGATRWSLAPLLTWLSIVCCGAAATVRAQSDPRAEANQLHTAIINVDVESLVQVTATAGAEACGPIA
jgi:hypothetical protein